MNKNIEILAPAGSMDALIAAVRCGADAVYLGGKSFSARGNAANFDSDELKKAVEYCHARGVKVHQTVNTLLRDDEFEKAAEVIKTACDAGVDALIVQDLGVAKLARTIAPHDGASRFNTDYGDDSGGCSRFKGAGLYKGCFAP